MTLNEIQKEIDRLNAIKREIKEQEFNTYSAKAAQFVGKCYRSIDGKVFKILAVPQRIYAGDFQWHYREHHFPALFLREDSFLSDYLDEFTPCYCDEIYFDTTESSSPRYATEITQEEFNAEFDKCIAYFKEQINV